MMDGVYQDVTQLPAEYKVIHLLENPQYNSTLQELVFLFLSVGRISYGKNGNGCIITSRYILNLALME